MKTITQWLGNPQQRRQALAIGSGSLILAALAAGHLLGLQALGDGLMAVAALLAGGDIAWRAVNSLRNRHVSIELLVTIAAAGALAIGEYWEAAAVTFLFIFGAYLEARTLSHTRQVLGDLLDLAPSTAIVLREGRQVEVLAHEVGIGETVLVKPGAKLSVDGEVLEGRSRVDESAITGEPIPEEKTPGSRVYAGTLNQAGLLQVQATGVGADTTLARIIRRVEEAQEAKAPTQRFIERFARWYTPAIIALSAVVFLISKDIELSLTLLVIGCPGALVISTPVSVVAGIGRAAKSGILIKGGEYLENAGKISALALDKTGTLTEGRPRLTDIIAVQKTEPAPEVVPAMAGAPVPGPTRLMGQMGIQGPGGNGRQGPWTEAQREVLRWAAIAEAGSEHPLAGAILEAARDEESRGRGDVFQDVPQAEGFETHTGRGVQAIYQGRRVGAGNENFAAELGVKLNPLVKAQLEGLKKDGKTAVVVILDGEVLGLLGIADPLRQTARQMIMQLKQNGLKRVVMLTGDDRKTAEAIASQAGIHEVHADLLPEEKLDAIRELQEQGYVVAMAGDGINDAPALAAADIGIAMGARGTDIAIETADIALISDDLMKIPEAIQLSKATLRNIHQNVVIALATVTILLLGVLLGRVHMAGGMLIHEASVLVVILNGMRLLRA